jgi:hypothetical protein
MASAELSYSQAASTEATELTFSVVEGICHLICDTPRILQLRRDDPVVKPK